MSSTACDDQLTPEPAAPVAPAGLDQSDLIRLVPQYHPTGEQIVLLFREVERRVRAQYSNDELRRAVRQMTAALDGNEWAEHVSSDKDVTALEVEITRLIGAAAPVAPAEPASEPVAWMRKGAGPDSQVMHNVYFTPPAPEFAWNWTPLYTSPALPPGWVETQRDAERYRWLRDSPDSGRMLRMMYGTVPLDDCDAMIDAAMTAPKVTP